jgi:opacity protein-like surface antigen
MKKFVNYLFIFSLVAVSVFIPLKSVSAQTGYVGIWGGYTISPDAQWESADFNQDLDIQETWAVGFKMGYPLPQAKYIAFEFEYFYWAPDVDRTVLGQVGTASAAVEGDAKLHSFLFNVMARYPEGRFHPYMGAGMGCSYVDKAGLSSSIGGVSYTASDSNTAIAFAWQILAGVEFDITKNLAVDLGYRYYTTKPEFGGTDIEFKTSMVTLGLKLLIF